MLQTSLLLMKRLNKTETPIFLSVVCSLFPKVIFLTFILHRTVYKHNIYRIRASETQTHPLMMNNLASRLMCGGPGWGVTDTTTD